MLGQEATEAKSNETIAIPLLLERLELRGALATIDAMGTHRPGSRRRCSTVAATICWR